METNNGATEKNNGERHNDVQRPDVKEGLGTPGYDSNFHGLGHQSRPAQDDSKRVDSSGTGATIEVTTAGKILQRLEQLEKSHYEYVNAHQSRLKARLDESNEAKEKFSLESAELKKDIYQLAIEEQESNGNGHKTN